MIFNRHTATGSPETSSRDQIRETAEALSLWCSAMHHIAARGCEQPSALLTRQPRRFHWGLLLTPALVTPALGAAVAAGVLVPAWSHLRHQHAVPAPAVAAATEPVADPTTDTRASVDDTALMNHIDSELSEGIPDALRPLADPIQQESTTQPPSESTNVTQE